MGVGIGIGMGFHRHVVANIRSRVRSHGFICCISGIGKIASIGDVLTNDDVSCAVDIAIKTRIPNRVQRRVDISHTARFRAIDAYATLGADGAPIAHVGRVVRST